VATMAVRVGLLAGCFGFLAADRWLTTPRAVFAELDEHLALLATVSAVAALTVHVSLA
jgi:hypothetical protein